MKKLFVFMLLILAGGFVFAQEYGVIRELAGTVELMASGAVSFTPATIGAQVGEDTVISTGFKSTALIAIESILIIVRPLTRLTLTEIRSQPGLEMLNVNLQAGRVRVDINPPAGTRASMTVVSPSAIAGARGTSFEFDTRNLYVNDGQVSFKGLAGQGILISAGIEIGLGESGRVINPVGTGSADLKPPLPVGTEPSSTPASVADIVIEHPFSGMEGGPGGSSNSGFDFLW